MVEGWTPIVIATELYKAAKYYYDEQKEQIKLRDGVRSLTGFINYCVREYMKEKGII